MVFYAAFNSISVISRRQLTLFMLSWVSPVLGWALKCLAQGHSHEKTQRIQCGSNPGPLDYESNTLPLSHVGPCNRTEVGFNELRVNVNETCYMKGKLQCIGKKFRPMSACAAAKADMGRNFSLSFDFLRVKGEFFFKIQSGVFEIRFK